MNSPEHAVSFYPNGINMPATLRPKGKATKIAWKVMGKPANLKDHKTPKDKYINDRLVFDETADVK
jgi:hypothetical protein